MSWIKTLRARHLSRKGEHAAALALCDMQDIFVLSRAGMHLSVLERSSRPSIEYTLALAHVGEIDAAVEMVQGLSKKTDARTLLGFLATQAPENVLQILDGNPNFEDIRAYCMYERGALTNWEEWVEKLPPLHGLVMALKAGNVGCARERFEAVFLKHGLIAPAVEWLHGGLQYSTLSYAGGVGKITNGSLISVILTAYNEGEYLTTAVNSLLAQSWQDFEIILINDASTDNTNVVADKLAARDDRIRVVHLDHNVGLWAAKNIGLQYCSGDVITMHDADDWSHPRKLELQAIPLFDDEELLATSSYMVRFDEHPGIPFTRNASNYLRWNPSSFMFRASLIEAHGGFLDHLLGSDCEFIARIETFCGVHSHHRLRMPLSIGLQRKHSLSNRFRSVEGKGLIRLQHWEDWRKKHVGMLHSIEKNVVI